MDAYSEWVLAPTLPERPTPPRASVVVCGVPRSGTWLLCGLLHGTGVAGRPHEWFSDATETDNRLRWGVRSFDEYLRRVLDAGTTPNGVFAAKLMRGALDPLLRRLPARLEDAFPGPRFVRVRRDADAVAVSWARAIQTGYWHRWDDASRRSQARFDLAQIGALAAEARADERAWDAWFARAGVEPLEVAYDELTADPASVTRAVLDLVGAEPPPGHAFRPLTTPTGDSATAWLARYRRLSGAGAP